MTKTLAHLVLVCCAMAVALTAVAAPKPRARDLGIPFDGTTGPLNAITDVSGIEVGFTTLIFGGPSDPKVGPRCGTVSPPSCREGRRASILYLPVTSRRTAMVK